MFVCVILIFTTFSCLCCRGNVLLYAALFVMFAVVFLSRGSWRSDVGFFHARFVVCRLPFLSALFVLCFMFLFIC